MQDDLNQNYPELDIHIIGMNERGHEAGNPSITEGRDIPWLQDIDSDNDGRSDVWLNSWDGVYRDVIIVNAQNERVGAYNLTTYDLGEQQNYDTLRQMFIEAASDPVAETSWHNSTMPLDVSGDSLVTPIDALLVLNDLNRYGARQLPDKAAIDESHSYFDTTGDGFISPLDALLVLNHLNRVARNQGTAAAAVAPDDSNPLSESSGGQGSTTEEPATDTQNEAYAQARIETVPVSSFFDADDSDASSYRRLMHDVVIDELFDGEDFVGRSVNEER